MMQWELLDSARVPGSREELSLYRRGDEYSIRVDREELMNSRMHGSEEALARMTCSRVVDRPAAHVLVGGLGMGFTLSAALRLLAADSQVTVAELSPAVVEWNRSVLAQLAGAPLRDARVTVFEGDVAFLLRSQDAAFDAILLDVDNGPEGFTREANAWLYARSGLGAAATALRPRGVLGVWSAFPDRRFTSRLRRAGFRVDEFRVPARGSGGREHTIWVAERAP